MIKKQIIILMVMFTAEICHADYELQLNDGVTLTWREYVVEGDHYCTKREMGKLCLLKRDVLTIKEIKDDPHASSQIQLNVSPRAQRATIGMIDEIPVMGNDTYGVELLDDVMLNVMKRIGCSTAVMAVAERGTMVYSRGYGWIDKKKKSPALPDTLVGIASCEKPITAAAIRKLARDGKLSLESKVFEYLKITPRGQVLDDRMAKITINHLLEHKAGWGADPIKGVSEILGQDGFTSPFSTESLLSVVMTQRLKYDPGAVSEYCNFGYDTLRAVLEKASGRRPADYFRNVLFTPNSIAGFYDAGAPLHKGDLSVVWNVEKGGPISASAPALLTFMRKYWLTGEPRDKGNPLWVMYGSLNGSTSIMVWRPDGIDFVALFNGRGDVTHDEISRDLQTVIDRLKEKQNKSLLK